MATIALAEAKARFSELVERAEAGETISITKRGRPVARLVAEAPVHEPWDIDEMKRLASLSKPYVDPDGLSYVERLRREDLL